MNSFRDVPLGLDLEYPNGVPLERSGVRCAFCSLMKNQKALMKDRKADDGVQPALQRDPDEWTTGNEPMTDAQRSYLESLCREMDEEFDA